MIVRISGLGQFELEDQSVRRLDALDTQLTAALQAGNSNDFHQVLRETIAFVRESGSPVTSERLVPSQVIVPPEDTSMDEAGRYFTEEGLMDPLPS